MFNAADHHFMAIALRLAAKGLYTTNPNPRVGCVIVNGTQIVGEGWHAQAGQAHAEIVALQQAGDQARGATAYVTLEPCAHQGKTPPCVEALCAAGIKRVVCAMTDPNPAVNGKGAEALRAAGINVDAGLMQAEAEALNPGFCSRMRQQRPFIRVKMAMSLDGRTALQNGQSQWITGESARLDVQRWRARSSAIMTGINTVLQDNPALNIRLEGLALEAGQGDLIHRPLRVVLDSRMQLPSSARLLSVPGKILLATVSDDPNKCEALAEKNVEVLVLPADEHGRPDLHALMTDLITRQIKEIMVESGHILAGALLQARLVDELLLYIAPALMGDAAKGLLHLPVLDSMHDKMQMTFTDIRAVGHDIRIIAVPQY